LPNRVADRIPGFEDERLEVALKRVRGGRQAHWSCADDGNYLPVIRHFFILLDTSKL
jgi:hypothetical protein